MAPVLRFNRRAVDRDGSLLAVVAPERVAAALGSGLPRATIEGLMASPRVRRRVAALLRGRLAIGERRAVPPAVVAFLTDWPRQRLVAAATLLGLAARLRRQGPLLVKEDLRRLALHHGEATVSGALELASRVPPAMANSDADDGDRSEDDAALLADGLVFLRNWAAARFGADASWIEAALPPVTGHAALGGVCDPDVVDRALALAGQGPA
jgi:hypothetical protein